MSYRELAPHPALSPFVDRLWVRDNDDGFATAPMRILPDGCIDMIVDLTLRDRVDVVGAMTEATVFPRRDPFRLVAVRFRPGGAVPFLRVPAHELTDRVVECGSLGVARRNAPKRNTGRLRRGPDVGASAPREDSIHRPAGRANRSCRIGAGGGFATRRSPHAQNADAHDRVSRVGDGAGIVRSSDGGCA